MKNSFLYDNIWIGFTDDSQETFVVNNTRLGLKIPITNMDLDNNCLLDFV